MCAMFDMMEKRMITICCIRKGKNNLIAIQIQSDYWTNIVKKAESRSLKRQNGFRSEIYREAVSSYTIKP